MGHVRGEREQGAGAAAANALASVVLGLVAAGTGIAIGRAL